MKFARIQVCNCGKAPLILAWNEELCKYYCIECARKAFEVFLKGSETALKFAKNEFPSQKRQRRFFPVEDKLRILAEIESAPWKKQKDILKREGISREHFRVWKFQRAEGKFEKKE